MCKVKIYDGAVDSFTVSYGDYSLEVNIDWERNYIKGPAKVSPYGFYKYRGKGTYSLDTPLAKIISQDGTQCEIEILTGRKGEFVLTCLTEDNEEKKLPIVISSFTGGKDAEAVGSIS
jgi:hypothetical protein